MEKQMEKEDEEIFHSPELEVVESKDEEEKKRISLMRFTLQNKDPSFKEVDESTLRRFLRARDQDVDKASTMLIKYLRWRRTFVPKGSISTSEISNQTAQNKMFMQGTDKHGRPIAVVFGSRHFPSKGSLDEFRRYMVFALDKLCSRMKEGQEKFTIIGDLKGYGYCNSDVRGNIAAISILQDYYPERLGKVLMINVPYIFMTVWKIIYPFIDKNTRKKIAFVGNKNVEATLQEDIEKSQLPKMYGGELDLVPIHDC